jgi:hypothetical protein
MADGSSISSQWTAAGVWLAALSFAGLLIRQVVPWKKVSSDSEAHLRADLIRRIERLERMLDRERTRHNAERSLDRHRLNNVTQCFDALLLLIETSPEKATQAVQKIKAMREAQLIAEAEEKAIIRAAEITADQEDAEIDAGREP